MPIVKHQAHGFWGTGGDSGFTGSITVNMARADITAQAGYHIVVGGGAHVVGIKGYRFRPKRGVEQQVDFGEFWNWRHTIGEDGVTSVTFGIALGAEQEAHAYGNLYWWS